MGKITEYFAGYGFYARVSCKDYTENTEKSIL